MRIITVFLTIVLIATTALAQKSVPPPPKPAPDGPSLEATMRFIQDKIEDEGDLNWTQTFKFKDIVSIHHSEKISNLRASSTDCRLDCVRRQTLRSSTGNEAVEDDDFHIFLKDVLKIIVEKYENSQMTIDPTIWLIQVQRLPTADKKARFERQGYVSKYYTDNFKFRDEETANRVAKALVHAVELCGGGKKEAEPF